MKVSTRAKYGVKAMVDLAINSKNEKCISLKSIATRQNIPENYLEQLMSTLKKAEIVSSIRGVQGGYILNKAPEHISVADLIKVLEGNLAIVDCVENSEAVLKCGTGTCSKCRARDAWEIISDKFVEAASSISLADLIKDNK